MMRVALLVVALVLPFLAHAQRLSHPVIVSRDDAFSSPAAPLAGPDTVRVLALMVQFQKDNTDRSTGDGQFDLTTTASPVLDSPPHDPAYFRNHLLFLTNYFKKSSKGKVIVQSTLLDQVVTLPTAMGTYAPARGGSNLPVANLAVDSWHAADSLHLVPDFSAYDAFLVLHAGAGRDLDLAGQLGYDPTPLDIPSLYLGLNAFKSLYGESYQGIPVNGGAFHITNTMIVPETETRSLPTATGDAPYFLSINGLLCASLGSYLGLPDLFNTATGASGIGRFGLMDGQAIFSYSGAFPPEPSAWEKYWLGWITPILVPSGSTTLALPAVALSDSVYRVPINATEYFLVENRNRDPYRTGQTVTSVYNGVTRQQQFAHDTTGFDGYVSNFDSLSGVITDVTSYDWSLPGAFEEDNGTWYDGGVLIWHIDESVISHTIASDAVNADPARRGVNLMEADGSQDIGQSYGFLSAGSGSEAGTLFDYWYQGNTAPVYKNEFSQTTHPSSSSNTGANSHINIHGFSTRGPRMTAVVDLGDSSVMPVAGFPKRLGRKLPPQAVVVGSGDAPVFFVATLDSTVATATRTDSVPPVLPAKVYAWTANGAPALANGNPDGAIAFGEGFLPGFAVGDLDKDGISECVLALRGAGESSWRMQARTMRDLSPADSLADLRFNTVLSQDVSTPPLIADSVIAFGGSSRMNFMRFDGTLVDTAALVPISGSPVAGISRFSESNAFIVTHRGGTIDYVRRLPDGTVKQQVSRDIGRAIVGPAACGESMTGVPSLAVATTDGYLYFGGADFVSDSIAQAPGFPVNTGGSITASPALADIDGDGKRDIVVFSGSRICVYTLNGASLDHFPVSVLAGQPLASNPVVADMDGDGRADIVGVTADGVVVAYDRDGKMVRGFPLTAGQGVQSVAAFGVPGGKIGLVVASSSDGTVNAWATGTAGSSWVNPWPQYQKDSRHTGYDATPLVSGPVASQEFFPASRAYNWPNPVYDGVTHIRYYTRESATIRIKIFDLAGDLVAEMTGPGVPGMDNEVEWNVGNVQSGIYFARIEASGSGGSGVNIVKVAVVK